MRRAVDRNRNRLGALGDDRSVRIRGLEGGAVNEDADLDNLIAAGAAGWAIAAVFTYAAAMLVIHAYRLVSGWVG
jgi:hypothetical protein